MLTADLPDTLQAQLLHRDSGHLQDPSAPKCTCRQERHLTWCESPNAIQGPGTGRWCEEGCGPGRCRPRPSAGQSISPRQSVGRSVRSQPRSPGPGDRGLGTAPSPYPATTTSTTATQPTRHGPAPGSLMAPESAHARPRSPPTASPRTPPAARSRRPAAAPSSRPHLGHSARLCHSGQSVTLAVTDTPPPASARPSSPGAAAPPAPSPARLLPGGAASPTRVASERAGGPGRTGEETPGRGHWRTAPEVPPPPRPAVNPRPPIPGRATSAPSALLPPRAPLPPRPR